MKIGIRTEIRIAESEVQKQGGPLTWVRLFPMSEFEHRRKRKKNPRTSMFNVESSMFEVRFVAMSYAKTQKQVQLLMFAGSIRFFVGMRDRTTMTATIAVDDFVPLVVRYRRRYRHPISTVAQTRFRVSGCRHVVPPETSTHLLLMRPSPKPALRERVSHHDLPRL
jgi:hypothetical protein